MEATSVIEICSLGMPAWHNVGCAPESDRMLRCREMTLRANNDQDSHSLGKFRSMAYGFNSMPIRIKNKGTKVARVVVRT